MRGRAVLLGGVALVVLGGCSADAPPRLSRHGQTETVTVTGDLGADGILTIRADVRFASANGGVFGLRAPVLANADDVRVNGAPRPDTAAGYTAQLRAATPTADITYRVTGAVERYRDVAIVTVPVWAEPGDARRRDPLVPVTGDLRLPAAPVGEAHWHHAAPAAAGVDGTTVHLDGRVAMWQDSDLVVALPADAFPSAPVLPGGPRLEYFEGRQAALDDADRAFADTLDNDERVADLLAAGYWGAVGVEIAVPVLVVLWRLARTGAMRIRAAGGVPDQLADPPGDESPTVVALLAHEGHDIGSEAVAATILDLADRKVIDLEGITSERFVLRLGPPARGTTPAEGAVLGLLRTAAGTGGELTGPPLVAQREGQWWRDFRRDTLHQATAAGLLRRRYPSALFITAVILLTLTTLPLWARSAEAAVGGLVVAGIFVMLPFIGGYVLSPKGLRARARWGAFARHARDNSEIADAGPPAIAVWGPHLSYGVALGVAGHAAEALSPRDGDARQPVQEATVR